MSKRLDRNEDIGSFVPQPDDGTIICRCEEITKGEIRKAVHEGMRTMIEVKRFLRAGMGLCQGQTCKRLVRGIIARELGVPVTDIELYKNRSPVRPIEMRFYQNEKR